MDDKSPPAPPERIIRIPEGHSVNLSAPFAALVDHADFQRLRRVRQLGPTHLLYPGAVHTRFEHSLGVFAAAQSYLAALSREPAFADRVHRDDLSCILAAALLHDVGHYPFAHSLEALHSRAFAAPRHEDIAAELLAVSGGAGGASLGDVIEDRLGIDRERVGRIVRLGSASWQPPLDRLLASVINSAVDADKLDYLERDSIHLGVPYGRMPDRERLLQSLTVNPAGDRIALREKGQVAGEIFLFCRYLMFSEAYWHHTVRAASAMIEEALADYLRREQPSAEALRALLLTRADDELLHHVASSSPADSTARRLLEGLTSHTRGLYKRVVTLSRQRPDTDSCRAYDRIYQMDRPGLEALNGRLRVRLGKMAGREMAEGSLLIDTPPRDKDRMDQVEILFESGGTREALPLDAVSRVAAGIANDFVKVVKRIRVFVEPRVRAALGERRRAVEQAVTEEILAPP